MCLAIGMDVHSKKLTSFAVPQNDEDIEETEFCMEFNKEFRSTPADRATLSRAADWLKDREHLILIENSTKTHEVFWILTDLGCTVVVANASDLFRITMSVKKTDYHDCRELAHYARRYLDGEKEFSTCLMVTAEQLNRRQLCRTYAHASSDLSDLRRRIRSYILARGIAVSVPGRDIVSEATLRELDKVADSSMRLLIDEARHQRDRMRRIKNEILKEFKDDETFQLIYSISGFGIVTASYLSAMIIDIDRFTSPGAYAAYHGVVPKQRESADHSVRCGITRRGDDIAREMLVTGTFIHISQDKDRVSDVSRFYDRLRNRGFPHKKALLACSNKMAHKIYTILKTKTPYRS